MSKLIPSTQCDGGGEATEALGVFLCPQRAASHNKEIVSPDCEIASHYPGMNFTELEKTRDRVCAEISSDSFTKDVEQLLTDIVEIPIRDGLLRFLYDNADLRKQSAKNLQTLLETDSGFAKCAVATVLAGCTWLDSDFISTRKALDLALEIDSTYSLARLLDVALTHGIPASVWADSLAAVSPEQCLTGAA